MECPKCFLVVTIFFALVGCSIACSCMRSHPQEQYCRSDFVILARIRKHQVVNDTLIYRIRIRKAYKLTEKAYVALKSGKIFTPKYDSLCGVQLDHGKIYVLSGRIVSLKARIDLCSSISMKWETTTKRQRKGLRLMYRYGCTCKINYCRAGRKCPRKNHNSCVWNSDCQQQEGICLRQADNKCRWTKNKPLTTCLKSE